MVLDLVRPRSRGLYKEAIRQLIPTALSAFRLLNIELAKVSLTTLLLHSSLSSSSGHSEIQNEMKFTALFAFVAAASATSIFPSTDINCSNNVGTIDACGDTNLRNFAIRAAGINFSGQRVTFFNQVGCVGARVSVESNQRCFPLPFVPGCVRISC